MRAAPSGPRRPRDRLLRRPGRDGRALEAMRCRAAPCRGPRRRVRRRAAPDRASREDHRDRKSTRLNSSHGYISYAVFCLKKKKKKKKKQTRIKRKKTQSNHRE